jgi:hypothetical protein
LRRGDFRRVVLFFLLLFAIGDTPLVERRLRDVGARDTERRLLVVFGFARLTTRRIRFVGAARFALFRFRLRGLMMSTSSIIL